MNEIYPGDLKGLVSNGGAILYSADDADRDYLSDLPMDSPIVRLGNAEIQILALGKCNQNEAEPSESERDYSEVLPTIAQQLKKEAIHTLVLLPNCSEVLGQEIYKVLQESGVSCVKLDGNQGVTEEDFMDEEDADEVAKRLRALGYL